jgi:hypothetical protein
LRNCQGEEPTDSGIQPTTGCKAGNSLALTQI